MKSFLTITDVASRLGLNESTVYRLVRRRKLPGIKIGGQWRFSEDLLLSWITDRVTIDRLRAEDHNGSQNKRK